MRRLVAKKTLVGVASVVTCVALAACGSSEEGSAVRSEGTGSLEGGGKEIVLFGQTRATPFIANFDKAAEAEAERLGYKLRIIETPDVNQTTQDGLVRQFLASGDKPAAFIWWPANAQAAAASARLLSRVAPVFQTDVSVLPDSKPFITAYAGGNHVTIGENAGKLMMELREKVKADGAELHDPRGNLLILNFPPGYQPGIDRTTGFRKATASEPFNILHEESGNYYAPQPAYQNATQLIPKYKDKVDFVFVSTTGAAVGVTKALAENGLKPGKNVFMVAGNCSGTYENLLNGEIHGASLMSPFAAATVVIDTIAQHLATGEVQKGSQTYPETPEPPEVTATPPFENNYIPLPVIVGEDAFAESDVFGTSGEEICT
jgi:ABC-type sugar transport system substrate-binding protein